MISRAIPAFLVVVVLLAQISPVPPRWGIRDASATVVNQVSPSSGPEGTYVTVTAQLNPGTVQADVTINGIIFANGFANPDGSFSTTGFIPAVPTGTYMAYVEPLPHSPSTKVGVQQFTVVPAGPPPSTDTPTNTATSISTSTNTATSTSTADDTSTPIATASHTASPTNTGTPTRTETPSHTPTVTRTATVTRTPTITPTPLTGVFLSVAPNLGPPGKTGVLVSAPAGTFSGSSLISLFFTDSSNNINALPPAVANTNGSIDITVNIPSEATAGTATISAKQGSSNSGTSAVGKFRVTQVITAKQSSAAPGGQVEVLGDGFSPNSTINFVIGSSPFSSNPLVITNWVGHFDAILTLPVRGLFPGKQSLSASDSIGAESASVYFTILSGPPASTATATATVAGTPGPAIRGSTRALFAEGYTGLADTNGRATFTEVFNILNPFGTRAMATITYYIQGRDSPSTVTRAIAASSIVRESVNADVGSDKLVAAVVTSAQRLFITRTITRVSRAGVRLDSSTTQPVGAASKMWYFAEGYTGITYQEYLTLLNPSNSRANVTVALAPQAARAAGTRSITLRVPPLSRITANIRSLNNGNASRSVGMIVTSDVPVVAERVEYFGGGGGSGKFGAIVSHGVVAPATQVRFAYGSSGGSVPDVHGALQPVGDQDFITLLNPSTRPGSIQVVATFSNAGGGALGRPVVVDVPAATRKTIVANGALGKGFAGAFSTSLIGTGPFVAESAQYYRGSPNQGDHPGIDYQGTAAPSTDVFFSDLSSELADGGALRQNLYVYNPNTKSMQVSVHYFGASGPGGHSLYSVPAVGITTIRVSQDTQAFLPSGPIGAELRVAPGSSGAFIAYSEGTSTDGLSATEEVGAPS
jgi:hypothetical protein